MFAKSETLVDAPPRGILRLPYSSDFIGSKTKSRGVGSLKVN